MKLLLLLFLLEQTSAQQRGLFPAILNLASNAIISSNATCGDPDPEVYCKLVDHVPGRRIRNPHCPKCDANSVLSKERHPITNAIDGTNQWFQSPSIKNGRQFHWITISLDLKQIFQVAYIIIKAANSPRPGNWILERSLDGVTFEPWQFYAISDTECLTRYNVTPRLGPPTYKRDKEVICTSYYSRLNPLEHGEIHTSLINGRPGADDLTSDLLNFTSARFIRLRLQRIRTLNADLMTLSTHDPQDIDPIVTRRYYYSIKDISVGGMCICYGHAKSCPLDPVTKKLHCVCEHNTCGENCNECCPGYHQQPWQPGTISDGNTCEKCNCHNKTFECFFNQTVAELSLSLDSAGVRRGGGVCVDCQQNTDGVNCETCQDGYYRPEGVSPYSESPCVKCNCDVRGSSSSVCVKDDKKQAGQCVCLQGYTGRQCDRCAFGYRDFPRCVRCECNLSGSTNSDPCRPCSCKVNVMGAHCDLCKPGFFNLHKNNPLGCSDCFCFGVSDVCESSTWSTAQVYHKDAWLRPAESLLNPAAIHDNDLIPSNASSGHTHQLLSWTAPTSFLSNKLVSYGGYLNYSVIYDIPLDNEDRSLPAHSDVIIEGNGEVVRLSPRVPVLLSPLAERSVAVAIVPQHFVHDQTGVDVTRDVLLSVLTNVTSLRVRVHLDIPADRLIRLRSVSLDVADSGSDSGIQAVAVETCECPWGYSGTSCESCLPGFYRVGGVMFGGNCMQCECNDHAVECDMDGVCLECEHNTTGPHCDHCLPGFYGDATEGTTHDCRPCPCPLTEPSNRFSPTCVLATSGQVSCDQCQVGYTGVNCERCATGYYGYPQVVGGTCVRCECNGNVDVTKAGHCDTVTGECLHCLGSTTGRHCEVCQPGYYGDAVQAKDCQECGCDVSGAISSVCNVTTGHCSCQENVTGRTCDMCQMGFFGLRSGQGCSACNCSQSGSVSVTCDEDGQCQCVSGVGGDKCERCSRGYYGYRQSGCTACTCDHTGGNCDPESGECICPTHTEGDTCDRCETGYWGHDLNTGCKPCSCSTAGSSSPQCDITNGQCQCKEGFSARSCDQCAPGYHGYPACSVCGCDSAGTDERFCNSTLGVCDCEHGGVCVCKVGVAGRHCEECVSGWFGLSSMNPHGCSQCFCSGLSRDCEERGGVYRRQVTLARSPSLLSVVSQSNLQGVESGVYQQGGDMLLDTRQVDLSRLTGPLYWRLPPQFEGDQLMSYSGLLSYSVTFFAEDGSGLSNQEPQVMMRGGTLKKHVIYTDMVAPSNGIKTQHNIRMTEYKWKYFNSVWEESVSHEDFMSVLSNVQYVIIKASYGTRLQQSRISNITMDTAVEEESEEESDVIGGVARFIESCTCPPGYNGLSCQECALGYFRQPRSELSSQRRTSMFVRPCVQCRCNNHSETCDSETGECQDCQHHTSGRRCELCAPGYHGKVSGSISDCSLCACPLRDNSFSSACVSEGAFGDFRCTSCQTGYEGRYCERCSVGYYGNPSVHGGRCFSCTCSGWGSLHPLCDTVTGQCECKAGVKGQSCERCEERYILDGGECVLCEDGCVDVLLDDLDKLHNVFLSADVSGISMAPYGQLVALENQTRGSSQFMFSQNNSVMFRLSRVDEDLDHVTSEISTLLRQVTHLSDHVEEVDVSTNTSLSQGALLLRNIGRLQERILVLQSQAYHVTQTAEEEFDSANQTHLLDELQLMLETMRGINVTAASATADQELSLSQSLWNLLHVDFMSSRAARNIRLQGLAASLTVHMEALQHISAHLDHAEDKNTHTHTLLQTTHTLLQQHKSVCQSLSVAYVSVDAVMEDAQLLLDDVFSLVDKLTNTSAQVELMGGQLDQRRPLLRKQVDSLVVGLKRTDALENVYQAESHADLLQNHALSVHSSLSSVCNGSQNGRQLFQLEGDITQQVDFAQQVASLAQVSSSRALNMSVQSERLLSEETRDKLNVSNTVLHQSQQLHQTVEDLQLNISMVTSGLRLVRESVQNSSLLLHQPIRELQSLHGSSRSLRQAQLQTTAAHSGLQMVLQQMQRLSDQLQDSSSVVENTIDTVRDTNELVMQTRAAANEAQSKLEEAEQRTEHLIERIKPLSILGEKLGRNLSDIRELIDQARRQAASIKVAVQVDRDGDCVRSYRPEIQSSNFNSLSLVLKTTIRQNLLFYLSSNTTVDYLAAEMHDGKVSLVWNLGSGTSRLDFPELDIANNKWTRINATRFGTHVSLSVHRLESETHPLPAVTSSSPGSSRVLDIDRNSVIHIGGLGAHTQSTAALRSTTFQGCLSEASLNERNIGLWNYDSREGQCGGCFSSPQTEETSFHFDGSGFSVVQKSLRATSTSIVLLFKTLSPGGLVLYLASNNTRDFLSIELVEGRVRLTFDLGSGALTLTSNRKYNSGGWYKITLQRNKRKVYLSIMAADQSSEKEVLEGESPGTASDLNRSDLDPIYIGGLPVSRPIRRQVVSRSYVGCIKNVEIARSNFDLLRGAFGVRKGCVVKAVRSVSLLNTGFVQIPPTSLGREAELLFSFSSNNQSGILLAGFSSDRQHFLSVQLVSGVLEVELGEGGGATQRVKVMKPDGGSFSDGKTHSVIVSIYKKSLSIQVDDDHLKSVPLLSFGFAHSSPTSIFIGGLPLGAESDLPMRLHDLSRLFRGCIHHLVLAGVLVDLSGAISYEGAEFDSCLLEEKVGEVFSDEDDVEPTPDPTHQSVAPPTHLSALTPGALTCVSEAEPHFLSAAAQFGLSKHSHMTFIINPNTVRRSLSVRLSVRTRASDGSILILTDSKHMDFIILRLTGGRLMMSADLGKGPASITSSVVVNDGHWHDVSAEVSRRSASVSVDGSSPKSVTVKGNQLDVDERLYLGSFPHTYTHTSSRRLNNLNSSLPGCLRSVSLNGAMLDLTKPTSQHDVTSCFSTDQTGSYFNGSGYAVFMHDGYKVGSDVSVKLEFRTSQSDGVFVGVSSAKVDAIGLEMVNGQVVFNVNNGAGRVSVRSLAQVLCDGQWHHLLATKNKHTLSLTIDGRSYTTINPYPQSTSAETNNPVYLGGYPVGVRQNCLSISSRFRGCLRNLQLIKSHLSDTLKPSSAHFLLGVTPFSCPV
ncbi:laminin subunit alpha-1 isoform X1 [Solea solea]|uniref:laminin subunit alpha-1 isoform X1 n=1 Tax=Solea solea TaxID=90069 RepID=UPI00272C80F7|nr:laminin subunit alpha-1 isoform X1 [Solea solea]XP_058485068.1 laminin subunit alpha-1 isoform X1 [Solea solea]XP_058485076.1 laminin subunit alpha-1 isoform X1 [Solea solea]